MKLIATKNAYYTENSTIKFCTRPELAYLCIGVPDV